MEDVFIKNASIDSSEYDTSVNPFDYKQRGVYHKFIESYCSNFPKEDIKIIIREEFTNDIDAIQNLYKFLEVDDTFIPFSINKVVNSSKSKIKISNDIVESLSKYYKQPNQNLQKILDRDLNLWQ
jgi:hypothetical protein